MKKFISAIILALLVISQSLPAFAAEKTVSRDSTVPIHVNFVTIRLLQSGLTVDSSGKASCTGKATLYSSSDSAQLSVQLQKYSNGSWSTVKTWSKVVQGNTPTNIVNSYYVVNGTYRVSCTIKVYNASGALLETQTAYSSTKTY
ncbi:hypothetical protein A7X67_02025 [Clostridium sp. W14A]|nr:hypothetical protein A7X67_02025 [Clostridium sp. W14A]